MAKMLVTVAAAGAAAWCAMANPLGFATYEREVRATFASPAEAAKAEMSIAKLPNCAKIAFTTRWDDCNPRHFPKRDMLNSIGYKGTFFMNGDENFLKNDGKRLIEGGNALGNHTVHHPFLMKGSVSKMFSEVVLDRIAIESLTDFPVVSFTIPFNWASEDPAKPGKLVRILCDSGTYVSSDWPILDCGVGPDTWMPGHQFDCNDKTPNEWVFNDRLPKAVAKAMKGDYPKVTFGMHSWCEGPGNDLQKKFLLSCAKNPEWFYGNDNEYGAHRYAGLHGKAVRKSVKGSEAVFTLTMFDPAQTGSDIPVSVMFSAKPSAVTVDGKAVAEVRGTWPISHSRGGLALADAAKADGTFAKFPGLKVALKADEFAGTLAIDVANGSASDLSDVYLTVLPAPGWKVGRRTIDKGALVRGGTAAETIRLGERYDDPDRWEGPSLYAVAVDFRQNGKACRAWATTTVKNPFVPAFGNHARAKTVPQEDVVKAGAPRTVSLNGTWKVSVPQCSDKPWGESKIEEVAKWVERPVPQNWNKAFLWEAYKKDKPYVMEWYTRDFEVDAKSAAARTFLSFEGVAWNTIIFVNGKEVGRHLADYAPFEVEITSAVKPGVNKLAVHCRWDLAKYANPAIPITHPSGNQWWYQHIHGGIWAPVALVTREKIAVTRLLANPRFAECAVEFDYVIDNAGGATKDEAVFEVVSAMSERAGKRYGRETVKLALKPGVNTGTVKIALEKDVPVWDVGEPELLWGVVKLGGGAAEAVRFGMREFKVKDGRFHLNGRPTFLFGQAANSQDFFSVGRTPDETRAAAEKRILALLDADCTFVRTVHEPISREFLDVADECGLPIFHEWAWGFSSRLDMTSFRPSCLQGVEEFIYGSYNHPSVVAWSMGNEVNVWEKEEVWKHADEVVELARKLDRQGRPVSSGSGAGAGFSGNVPVKTDILDFHDYVGCSTPWAGVLDEMDRLYASNEKKYGAEAMKKMPIIGMEMLGFSWLNGHDPDYKPGDRQIYQKFLDRRVDWGGGQGAGLLGAMPMEIVVKKNTEFYDLACNRYGRRLFEEMRLHPLAHGFAPWGDIPTESTVWTQPLFPALRNAHKLNPRNLFAGETDEWTAYVHNGGREAASDLELEVSLNGAVLAKVKMPAVGTDEAVSAPVKIAWPKHVRGAGLSLGLRILQRGQTVGVNSYEVFFADRGETAAPVKAARPVAVMDCGNAANVARTVKLLKGYGIDATTVKSAGEAKDGSLLVIPPDYDGPQKFFGAKQEVTDFVSLRRGTLLILEQHGMESALPASQQLFKGNANFTDLVLPSHPAFAGLTWRQFDTWNNPDHGRVAVRFLSPFRWENSLAVKGPQLSTGNEFGSVLFEGTSGEGRFIISLFEAVKCAPTDSVAATYLRNLISYAAGATYCKDAKPVSGGKPLFAGKAEDVVTFDLRKYANAGFADRTPAEDKKGGWLDQGDNDFRNVAAGRRTLRGVPFDVIEPEKNNDLAIIRVAGKQRPYFPESVKDIKLGGKYDRLYFLHTAGYAHEGTTSSCGAYRMRYADGTTADFRIDSGANIADWWNARDCPKAPIGLLVRSGKGANVAAYIAAWDNPHPEKEIVSFDFLSAAALRAGQNAWAVTSDPVPVLIAVSGLKAGAAPKGGNIEFDLSGKEWNRQSTFITGYPDRKVTDIVEDGRHGMEIPFPAWTSGKDKCPFVMLWHKLPKGVKFTELVFQAKADDNVTLQFVIPQRGWKFQIARYAKISGGGDWQEVRVNLTGKSWDGREIDWNDLFEELFIHYCESDKKGVSYPAAKVSIKDLKLIAPAPAGAADGGEFDLSGKQWNRQSSFVNGHPDLKVKDIVEDGRHGMEIPFPAWTDGKDKCPFVMLWHKLPKGRKFKELVFQAKAADNTTLQFVIPQKGWKFQLARYAKISGGGDWQEVRVNLTGKSWDGRVIDWDDLIEELFIHYCAPDSKGKAYPAATVSIKDLRLIDAD